MTKQELSQLYWLNKEIKEEKRRLDELEAAATGCTAKITGLPHVGGKCDKTSDFAILIAEQRDLIDLMIKRSIVEYDRLNRYIASVEDAQIRMVLSLRYINGLSWQQIAFSIGVTDEQLPRKWHNAFLKKDEKYALDSVES